MKQLSVIIVSYNVRYYLEQCLRSVLKAADGIDSEVIVIDNASDDASLEYLDNRTEARIEVVSGAYMFVRGDAFRSVGGFDETFFMYGEDIDLSYRIQQSGYENWYLPVRILHYKGENTNKTSYRYAKVFYNAMLIFFDKHYKGINFLFRWSVHLAVSVQTLLTYMRNNLFKGRSDSSSADDVWLYAGHQEHLDGLKRMIEPAMGDVVFSGESLPPKAVRRDYTLYDISSFGFGEILDNLADGDGASVICTFNPSSGIILTDSIAVRNG